MVNMKHLEREVRQSGNQERARACQRYFKTGPGEYGEGDIFLGLSVPQSRSIAKKYTGLDIQDLQKLLDSEIHEHRFIALLILLAKYRKAEPSERKVIFDFYLRNTRSINNWDLVDTSAPGIIGNFLMDKDRSILYELAKSESIWERRIAMLATFAFIRNSDFRDATRIAGVLLNDKHDLIHKAVGWMLREIGKRDRHAEERFLVKCYKTMPRTMLRYAIEKFPEEKRRFYLGK
jgi:3-methyladenine DNA glycosylase AlkD